MRVQLNTGMDKVKEKAEEILFEELENLKNVKGTQAEERAIRIIETVSRIIETYKTNTTKIESIKKGIVKFYELEREDIERAKKKEIIQVNINPDSYIGKEILYQSALLKQIQEEIQERKINK